MADKKISALDPAATLTGTELIPVVQGGVTTRVTAQAIADLGTVGSAGMVNLVPDGIYPGTLPTGVAVTNPLNDGFIFPHSLMDLQLIPGYGDAVLPVAAVTPQTANTVRAQPLYISKSIKLSKWGTRVTTLAAGATLMVRIYDSAANGRPGLPMHAKQTLSLAATGWVEASFPEITLTPGLYWVLYVFSSTTPRVRGFTGGGRNVYFGGDAITGLTQAAAAARLDSADLSTDTWTVVTGVEAADAVTDVCAGNFAV